MILVNLVFFDIAIFGFLRGLAFVDRYAEAIGDFLIVFFPSSSDDMVMASSDEIVIRSEVTDGFIRLGCPFGLDFGDIARRFWLVDAALGLW